MARISVRLPEELVSSLEPHKEQINVSQVCRESIERRVAAFERAAEGGEELDLDELVARLREERELAEAKFETLARRNAGAWLRTTSYVELKGQVESNGSGDAVKSRLPHAAFRTMKHDLDQARVSYEGPQAGLYKTAWVDYVRAVWLQLEDRVEDGEGAPAPEQTDQGISDEDRPADPEKARTTPANVE